MLDRRLPYVAFVTLAFAFAACGGDDGGEPDASVDAELAADAAANPDANLSGVDMDCDGVTFAPAPAHSLPGGGGQCNPVNQAGCNAGEKCALRVINPNPFQAVTECLPDGNVPLGGACMNGVDAPNGIDDCAAGGHCSSGVCLAICEAGAGNCGPDASCTLVAGLFEDITVADIGLCRPNCDAVEQDCPGEDEACYPNLGTGEAACSFSGDEMMCRRQGQPCLRPAGATGCYLNGCDLGHAGLLPTATDGTGETVCAFLCNPSPNGIGMPDTTAGDPNGINCNSILVDRPDGPGNGHQCRYLNSFYAGVTAPDTLGMCVDPAVWGDCTEYDPANPMAPLFGCVPLSQLPAQAPTRLPMPAALRGLLLE